MTVEEEYKNPKSFLEWLSFLKNPKMYVDAKIVFERFSENQKKNPIPKIPPEWYPELGTIL